jgi:P27 family predicted phage terminase small subunit
MRGRKPQSTSPADWQPPSPPADLTKAEREAWDRLLGTPAGALLDESDSPVLRALCEAVVLHERIRGELADSPLTVVGFGGAERLHPLVEESRRLREQIARLSSGLGFSPTSRRGASPPQEPPASKKSDPKRDRLNELRAKARVKKG